MPHQIDVKVGRKVRARRSLLGLSQTELANHVGITFQQVQKYEGGKNRISASRLYQFAEILSVPVSYFFEETDINGSQASAIETPAFEHEKISNRESLELMRAYYRINDPRVRKRIFELIKSVADDASVT
jgi:transcriptional regulator with XRE-family HTH domain